MQRDPIEYGTMLYIKGFLIDPKIIAEIKYSKYIKIYTTKQANALLLPKL